MTTQSITSITDGQKKQYLRFVEDAALRALKETVLDKCGLQKLIENGDEFQARIIQCLKELSVGNQFVGEEVQSSYAYPTEYRGAKPIEEQMEILKSHFPNLVPPIVDWNVLPRAATKVASFELLQVKGSVDSKSLSVLPSGAEGWFAIPKWQTLGTTYGEAVEKVLAMIGSKRTFYNYRKGQTGPEYLRQHVKSAKMFQKLGLEQNPPAGGDILVVPAQFGLRHRGRSVRRAREVFTEGEFGLGAFAIGIMVLTHPERLVEWERLHVDCAGDEFSPVADGVFSGAPVFGFHGGGVGFGAVWFGRADGGCGSASAFLPVEASA